MRTTLTLEDDVAVQLEVLKRRDRRSLKTLVNEALRRGLHEMAEPPKVSQPFRTRTFDAVPLLPSFDNIAEVLAIAEGEDFK